MNALLERPVTYRDTDTVPDMLIDFDTMTWTCTAHNEVMRLDSGEDCPSCRRVCPTEREIT